MGKAATLAICEHEDAMLIEDADLHKDFKGTTFYFCPLCGNTLTDEAQDAGFDPTQAPKKPGASHLPKAPTPAPKLGRRGMPGRTWSKDQSKKIVVTCQFVNCQNQFTAWPHDDFHLLKYCPQLHRGLHKWQLLRARQKRYREKLKHLKTSTT